MPKVKSEDTLYIEKVKKLYAECIDYAANGVHLNIGKTIKVICRNYGTKFDTLDHEFLDTYNGEKLIKELVDYYFYNFKYKPYQINTNSNEYKLGLYLAEMGLYSKIPFRDIIIRIHTKEMIDYLKERNYSPDSEEFIKFIRKKVRMDEHVTRLKIYRERAGLSQNELAEKARVNVRNIQMYEQRNNDINSASAAILKRLSNVLEIEVDELLETETL